MFNVMSAINLHVLQLPSSQNGNTAIVSGSIVLPDGRAFSEVSSISPSTPFAQEDTLTAAMSDVTKKIEQKAQMGNGNREEAPRAEYRNNDKNQMNGGGNKPASRSQISFIRNKAQEQGKNPDGLAASRFGKAVQDLVGCEADSLIKELLNRA